MPRTIAAAPWLLAQTRCLLTILLAPLLLTLASPAAQANNTCEDGAGVRVVGTPALAFHDPYNPFASSDLSATIPLSLANHSPMTCELAIIFVSPDGNGELVDGGETLSYTLETTGGTPLLRHAGTAVPEAGAHMSLTLAPGDTGTISVRARVPARQLKSPGTYLDSTMQMRVYQLGQSGGFNTMLHQSAITVSLDVAAVCKIAPPTPATVDFSGDIGVDGRPRGNAQAAQLHEAACNTSGRMKLSGTPLRHEAGLNLTGFDDFLNFEAEAQFGAVVATLITSSADPPDESTSALTSGLTNAPIDINLRLQPGRPLVAGHYSGILSITLEPLP